MIWTWALAKVPWKTIIVHAPAIVEAARSYYATSRRSADAAAAPRSGDELGRLRRAVQELEAREVQQAALFTDLAKQVQEMARALEVLRARILIALAGTSVAVAGAVVALAVALLSR